MTNEVNDILNKRMELQAEEAKLNGFEKLGSAVQEAIETPIQESSYEEMVDSVYRDLWKAAMKVFAHYELETVDISKIDRSLSSWASKFVNDIEVSIDDV